MTTQVVPGKLVALPEAAQVAGEAALHLARVIEDALRHRGRATIALSGGNTPRDAYHRLASAPRIDWTKVDIYWVDERAVAPDDDRSNYRWARATLLEPAGVPSERVHRMRAEDPDGAGAAREYEQRVRDRVELDGDGVPAFDVLVLGIGEDGHTASLFPGEPTVDVVDRLVAWVPPPSIVPGAPPSLRREARMTLTAPVIEHARAAIVLAVGSTKRVALERVWSAQGELRQTPARVIRGSRGEVTWIIDRAAGGLG